MIGMTVEVTANSATPTMEALRVGLQSENLLPFLAEAGTQQVQENLMGLQRDRPNKVGGTRTNYYQQAADNTEWHMEGDHAVISIHAPGIAMRYFGGVIHAGAGTVQCGPNEGKKTKYLTIPVSPESYGRKACDVPDLVVLWGRNGPYALGRKTQRSMATQTGGGATAEVREVLYILKTDVEISPDKSLLPSELRVTAALKSSFADYVSLLKEEGMKNAL